MRLYLVRHPEPDIEPGICYGRFEVDVARDRNAVALAGLKTALPLRVPLFSSPASRCAGLAAMLAEALECGSPVFDARLAEIHFGTWEMRRWNEIPRTEIDAWAADPVHYRPGGGETVREAAQRVCAFHAGLLRSSTEQAIVVCHAGTIRLLLACGEGRTPDEAAQHAARTPQRIAYGTPLVMDC